MPFRLAVLCLGLLCAAPAAAQPAPFAFAAFGDMPYCDTRDPAGCPAEVARVQALAETINRAAPAFSIFVGDSKGGGEACTDAIVFDRTLEWMGRIAGPLVYTPGDNEWTDCWQDRAGRFDPLALLRGIRARFFAEPRSLGQAPMPLTRQADVSPAQHALYVENARWEREGVLFLTAHVPGSDNNNAQGAGHPDAAAAQAEYQARDAANVAWIAEGFALAAREGHRAVVVAIQADIHYRDRCGRGTSAGHEATRAALAEGARRFGRPVLLIHGDSHVLLLDNPLREVRNLTRLMVPGASDVRAVLVRVDPAAEQPFAVTTLGTDPRRAPAPC